MFRKISRGLNIFVFVAATLAIAGVFYEGMKLQWYDVVGILILFMDYSFLLATVINLIVGKGSKYYYFDIISVVALVIAFGMKFAGIPYPTITLVIWYFYIWFLYGIRIGWAIKK